MTETATLTLMDRYLALPRAIQWALLAAAGVALFFIWDSYINPLSDGFSKEANRIQSQVKEIRDSRKLADDLRKSEMEAVVASIGPVKPPRGAATGSASLTKVVNDLMKVHAIGDQDFSLRTRGKLARNVLVQVLGSKRGERLTGDLKFSAKPEVALAILCDLETSPDIEQVSSVRLTKDQNGKVKVHYVLEAWVIASEGSSSAAGAAL
jgi:hypothetical protein